MKFVPFSLLLAALASAPLLAHEGHDAKAHAKHEAAKTAGPGTLSGEIVDMACYMGHGAMGKKHSDCAKQCILGGAPMGLVTEKGGVYLLVENHDKKEAYVQAKDLAGKSAKLSGTIASRGGVQALIVDKIEK
ncbi:MAG: hypothetical protein HY921_01355 [Elusimicrobia bacterium]|nr:hypothetical protein [Elusimicrobiota bacterium]